MCKDSPLSSPQKGCSLLTLPSGTAEKHHEMVLFKKVVWQFQESQMPWISILHALRPQSRVPKYQCIWLCRVTGVKRTHMCRIGGQRKWWCFKWRRNMMGQWLHTRSVSEQKRCSLGSQAFLAIVHPCCHRWKEPVQCLSSRIRTLFIKDADEHKAGKDE